MATFDEWGIRFIAALQRALPGLDPLMRGFTDLGRAEFFFLLIPLVYWCVDSRVGIRLATLIILNAAVNDVAKLMFHQPRPYWLDPNVGRDTEWTYGIPSGHAQGAVVVWFYLASRIRRRWAWAAAAVLAFLISLSRLYLGVHFPQDILVGWVLAALVLLGFLRCCGPIPGWMERWPPAWVAALSLFLMSAIALLVLALLATLSGVAVSPAWAGYAKDARSFAGTARAAGVLPGLLIGYALQTRHVGFDAGGPFDVRAGRFAVGVFTLAGLFLALGFVGPREGAAGELVRALRYFLVLLWATLGAPWLFVKLRLASTRAALGE